MSADQELFVEFCYCYLAFLLECNQITVMKLLRLLLVLYLCVSLCSVGSAGRSAKKAAKKFQQNTLKRVAEAKAEARRAREAKEKEILLPYVPKSRKLEESVSQQEKKRRDFLKMCSNKLPKLFNKDQRGQFCNGNVAFRFLVIFW